MANVFYKNGFAISDSTQRVVIEDSKPAYWYMSMPMTGGGVNSGEQTGPVTHMDYRVGTDAEGKMVYQDVAVTPYSGKTTTSEGWLFTSDGKLLCDSTGVEKFSNKGVPMTISGCVCIESSAPPPPPPPPVKPGKVNITKLEAISDTSVRVTITKPATGTEPISYKCGIIQKDPAKAWTEDVAMTFNGTVGTGVIEGMTPATINTIGCYGVNAAGQGDNSGTTMDITMPDYSVPVAPTLDNVYVASTSAVLAYTYTDPRQTGRALEPMFYTGYAKDSNGKVTKREVYDPDQDLVIYGLTTGVVYDFWVTATSISEKEGPASNSIKATTKTVIAAPVVKSIVAGDASATATFDPVTPDAPWTIDHYSFLAVNLDNPDAPEVSGHCVSGTPFPLENDINWSVSICAVCNPGLVPGDFSASFKVSPEKKVVPFKPTITQAYANPDGTIKVDWVKGSAQSGASQSGLTITKWTIRFECMADSSKSFIDYVDPPTQTFTSHKVDAGEWKVTVSGKNDVGDGPSSFPAYVTYTPTKEDPILGGQIYRGADGDPYDYCLFYSNATTGYEAIRTEVGKNLTFEVLLVGPGGGGKGSTLTGGQGGAGGGGQLVYDTLPPTGGLTSIFVTVPSGGKTGGDDPANATVKEASKTITAIAGKTATNKNDAEGYPKQKVEASWSKLSMFTWLLPGSAEVGGSAQSYEQNFPNATFCGEGGAGTKTNKGGNAEPSYCAIRWKKLA